MIRQKVVNLNKNLMWNFPQFSTVSFPCQLKLISHAETNTGNFPPQRLLWMYYGYYIMDIIMDRY